jgi:hypothetical protein
MRSKTTLRGKAYAALLGISEDLSSFLDATDNLFRILELRHLGADQSENNGLVLGQVSQGLEISGSRCIIYY